MDSSVSEKLDRMGNNRLRARLEAGEPVVGLTITTSKSNESILY